ncbi:MAG: serine hydroxymethyltransferase [Candidatus Roizmanbacteria bacterium]
MLHQNTHNQSEVLQRILKYSHLHTNYRNLSLNLIASENLMSPMTQQMLSTDMGNRYSYGEAGNKVFAGTDFLDEIEQVAVCLTKELFSAEYANVQPISGMVANLVTYNAVLEKGDTVMSLPVRQGGHYSHDKNGILKLFGVNIEYLPFNNVEFCIDIEKAEQAILFHKPKAIIVGAMEFLFPVALKELKEICQKTGTFVIYDGAHVAGLIAGKSFQDPLKEGADILTFSTNKTLGGPDHGVVACADAEKFQEKIWKGIPLFVSNNHPHHIAGLAVTLSESQEFGKEYASQVVQNAKTLAQAMFHNGVDVLCSHKGFTQSHTVLVHTHKNAMQVMRLLESAEIMSSTYMNADDTEYETGLRFGTNELTRLGMKEQEMKTIGKLIADVLFLRITVDEAKMMSNEIRRSFQSIQYCY